MKKITTFFATILLSAGAFAQIPNAGFENWTTMSSYATPDQWDNLNAMTSIVSTYTCMKGTPGNPGSSYLKLVSKTVTGMGVVPGIAISGTLDMSNMANIKPKSGFAYASRPAQLTGNWQYMAYNSDQGFIAVMLTKWNAATNSRDTVATAYEALPGMVMSWASFSINLTYLKGSIPDSAMILLSASQLTGASDNSYLYIDNLAFTGNVPSAVNNVANNNFATTVYPNPATSHANIAFYSAVPGHVLVKLTDLNGRTITQTNVNTTIGNNTVRVNTAGIAKGLYFLNISDDTHNQSQKLVIE